MKTQKCYREAKSKQDAPNYRTRTQYNNLIKKSNKNKCSLSVIMN